MDGGSSLGVVQPFLLQDLGQILPPAEDESLADHVEPGSDEQARLGRQHLLQLGRGDVSHRADLVGVHFQFHIFLDEEDVVDLVFPPLPIRGRFVNDASEEVQLTLRDSAHFDSELMFELSKRCLFGSRRTLALCRDGVEGVGAASVCPMIAKGDLFCGSLLEQHLALAIEQEDRESAMQQISLLYVLHKMALMLGGMPNLLILAIDQDAFFSHQTKLLLVHLK